MTEVIQPGMFRRIRFTPVRDALRGRFTGRLDVRHTIDASGLPAPARELVRRVVARTRLWRQEQIDVAEELIEHFAAGLAVGASMEGLIQYFGDDRIAARLIRRSKIRNRSVAKRALNFAGRLIAVMLIFYVGLGIYFFSGAPIVKVNYVDALNHRIEQIPPEQRGWPLYRRAMLSLGDQTDAARSQWPNIWTSRESPQLTSWLRRHADAVELARQGAVRPVLGYLLSPHIRPEDAALYPNEATYQQRSSDVPLNQMYLPYTDTLGFLTGLIAADARLARSDNDPARFVRDVEALMNLAKQMRGDLFAPRENIALAAVDAAIDCVGQTLVDAPNLLSDEDLQRLAHLLSEPHSAADLFDPDAGSFYGLDALQRAYTDNGAGGGRITPAGLKLSDDVQPLGRRLSRPDALLRALLWPAALLTVPSRQQTAAELDRALRLCHANLQQPYRLADWSELRARPRAQQTITALTGQSIKIADLARQHWLAEFYLGERDGLVVVIALEAYHRRHHAYPKTLAALVPEFLTQVPADRITGEPVHYRLVDGKPVIYSVGADRDDDDGRLAIAPNGKTCPSLAVRWGIAPDKAPDGDWMLFPIPRDNDDDD